MNSVSSALSDHSEARSGMQSFDSKRLTNFTCGTTRMCTGVFTY